MLPKELNGITWWVRWNGWCHCQVVSIYVAIWPRNVLSESLSCKNASIYCCYRGPAWFERVGVLLGGSVEDRFSTSLREAVIYVLADFVRPPPSPPPTSLTENRCEKRRFFSLTELGGTPPPLTENQCGKKKDFFLSGKGGYTPPP